MVAPCFLLLSVQWGSPTQVPILSVSYAGGIYLGITCVCMALFIAVCRYQLSKVVKDVRALADASTSNQEKVAKLHLVAITFENVSNQLLGNAPGTLLSALQLFWPWFRSKSCYVEAAMALVASLTLVLGLALGAFKNSKALSNVACTVAPTVADPHLCKSEM